MNTLVFTNVLIVFLEKKFNIVRENRLAASSLVGMALGIIVQNANTVVRIISDNLFPIVILLVSFYSIYIRSSQKKERKETMEIYKVWDINFFLKELVARDKITHNGMITNPPEEMELDLYPIWTIEFGDESAFVTITPVTRTILKGEKNQVSKLGIRIEISNENVMKYFERQKKDHAKRISRGTNQTIMKMNCLDDCWASTYFYDGKRKTEAEMQRDWFESLFVEKKDRVLSDLRSYINSVETNAFGTPRAGFIFHGPPGTGKTDLARRLAHMIGYNFAYLDLNKYILDKVGLLRTLSALRRAVVIVDEIDSFFDNLYEKEDDNKEISKGKPKMKDRELLPVFDGSYVAKNVIFMATTNRLERMRKRIPELFRVGRLKPVQIDYLSWNELQRLSRYYFDKELSHQPFEIRTATSAILETVHYIRGRQKKEKRFQYFEEYIAKLCEGKDSEIV